MKLLGRRKKRRPKKISMDVVKEDMKCVCVTEGIGGDGGRQPAVATPKGSSQKNKKKLHIVIMLGYSSFARLLGAGRHLVSQCFVISTDMHCALYKCCVLNTLASTNPHWLSTFIQPSGLCIHSSNPDQIPPIFQCCAEENKRREKGFFFLGHNPQGLTGCSLLHIVQVVTET